MQLGLATAAVAPELVDLRRASCTEVDWPRADLVIADPPWRYSQSFGKRADDHYDDLSIEDIVAHLAPLAERAPRLALWITWPLQAEWIEATRGWAWGRHVTGGCWTKASDETGGRRGQGFHWSGDSEIVMIYKSKRAGRLHNDRSELCRNGCALPPQAHSVKPARWMARWIARWVPTGGLVLDPYAGLASVAEAVLLAGEGRRYLGTEINEERHARAGSRLATCSWRSQ